MKRPSVGIILLLRRIDCSSPTASCVLESPPSVVAVSAGLSKSLSRHGRVGAVDQAEEVVEVAERGRRVQRHVAGDDARSAADPGFEIRKPPRSFRSATGRSRAPPGWFEQSGSVRSVVVLCLLQRVGQLLCVFGRDVGLAVGRGFGQSSTARCTRWPFHSTSGVRYSLSRTCSWNVTARRRSRRCPGSCRPEAPSSPWGAGVRGSGADAEAFDGTALRCARPSEGPEAGGSKGICGPLGSS